MKRLVAILLSALLIIALTACDFQGDTNDTDDKIDQPTHANPEHFANFSSYDEIIRTFKAIVNCFSFYTEEEYLRNEFTSMVDFPSLESEEIYKKLFFSAYYYYNYDYVDQYLKDGRNYFGYAIHDINGNGSDELILLNDHYNIIAIFTNYNGKPQLVIDNQPECRIDSAMRIYTQEYYVDEVNEYFPNFDRYYTVKVHELNECDELVVIEEYQAINPHDDQGYSFYVDLTQGEGVEISHEVFIEKTHGCLNLTNAPIITKSSVDLNFVRLFSSLKPYIPEINSMHWTRPGHREYEVYINHLTDESVGIGFLSSASQYAADPYVTAARKGERAYFETEWISGYLEFGLDSVWIVITESQVQSFPCGAYFYTSYVVHKG